MISFVGSDPTSALFVIQGVTFNLIRRVKKKKRWREEWGQLFKRGN